MSEQVSQPDKEADTWNWFPEMPRGVVDQAFERKYQQIKAEHPNLSLIDRLQRTREELAAESTTDTE